MLLTKKTIHSVLFWGKKNTEIFFNIGLPTILSKGNLDKQSKHIFFFITTPQDEKEIILKDSFKILDKRAQIKIIYLKDDLTPKFGRSALINVKYVTITMNKAFDLRCGHFCWSADSVVSNNLFIKIHEKITEGYKGIGSVGDYIQLNRKSINFFKKKKGIININSLDLIKFALKNKGKININNIIDNKLKLRSQYPSRVSLENFNYRLSFGHKFHPLYLEPEVRINEQFIGSVDYALAPTVINLKKYYILGSFTEKDLKEKKYMNFNLQDPVFFTLSDINKSIYNINHINKPITPKIMAYHWSKTYFCNEKKLIKNIIIQNWFFDQNIEKKIILIKKFRKQVLRFLILYEIYNVINFYYIRDFLKKKFFFTRNIVKKILNILIKMFNFFINKI
jgi:hypothetical protein